MVAQLTSESFFRPYSRIVPHEATRILDHVGITACAIRVVCEGRSLFLRGAMNTILECVPKGSVHHVGLILYGQAPVIHNCVGVAA